MYLWQQYANSDFADKIALRDHSLGHVFSWRELAERINESVSFLQQQSINGGCGVALCGKNSLDLLCYYLAALQLNNRVLGLNPAFQADKKEQICVQNQIALRIEIEAGKAVFIKSEKNLPHFASKALTMTLTSGSTGMPKAVVHEVQAHLDNARGVCELTCFDFNCAWLLSLPLYHVSGQGIVWRWLLQGAELHLPGGDFYDSALQVTHASFVPTQLQRFLLYVKEKAVANFKLQHILLGGTQISTDLTEQLNRLGIQSYTGYGMTETASTVFAKKSDGKPGVGQPLNGREYCLIDDEIWLRGAGLGLGYWQHGKIKPLVNSQGWLQTKDKGRLINGELQILGRLDNMFISGGENIQPEEIEQLIQQFVGVEQVFVLPLNEAEFGQRPVAMIKFASDVGSDFFQSAVNNLHVWLSDKIEKFKQPVAYYPLNDEMLRKGGIKVSRQLLKTELQKILGK